MKKILPIVFLLLAACSAPASSTNEILLVSTTSTQDSGLLDVLLPAFTQQTGYKVSLVATGSGQALKMAEQGNADVILVHSPDAEKQFVANGYGIDRRLVMHNDFVIVGPDSDPASLQTRTSAADALAAIFFSASTFISRGDQSGTHVKELALWNNAGLIPFGKPWYVETGQGQGVTLSVASERQAYAITDRGTFLAYRANLDLIVLFEGDPSLLNVYHVIIVNPEKWPNVNLAGAQAFADFVASPAGQQIIRDFGVDRFGEPLFLPDAGLDEADLGLQDIHSNDLPAMDEIFPVTFLSLQVSIIATLVSLLIGLPFGTWLALGEFRGRAFILSIINTGMALPPVVVGLVVAMTLWRSGPLGDLRLIYTPWAIIIAQTVIAAPVVTGLTAAALASLDPRLSLQLLGLGASRGQMIWTLWREARLPLLAALMAGFGSVISEVGASMMVGGNIKGQTRVLTTAIVLETSKGEFEQALALSALLLVITYLINLALTVIQQKGARR